MSFAKKLIGTFTDKGRFPTTKDIVEEFRKRENFSSYASHLGNKVFTIDVSPYNTEYCKAELTWNFSRQSWDSFLSFERRDGEEETINLFNRLTRSTATLYIGTGARPKDTSLQFSGSRSTEAWHFLCFKPETNSTYTDRNRQTLNANELLRTLSVFYDWSVNETSAEALDNYQWGEKFMKAGGNMNCFTHNQFIFTAAWLNMLHPLSGDYSAQRKLLRQYDMEEAIAADSIHNSPFGVVFPNQCEGGAEAVATHNIQVTDTLTIVTGRIVGMMFHSLGPVPFPLLGYHPGRFRAFARYDIICSEEHTRLVDNLPIPTTVYRDMKARKVIHTCKKCRGETLKQLIKGECFTCIGIKPEQLKLQSYNADVLQILERSLPTQKYSSKDFQPTPLLYGCELEYNVADPRESDDNRMHFLLSLKDHILFKSDGSLHTGGFEMVTTAAPYEVHMKKFSTAFEDFPDNISKGNPEAGMHIHASRDACTTLQVARAMDFMHNPDNAQFIELIAERPLGSYCHQDTARKGFAFMLRGELGNRHVAMNLSRKKTMEFRIFLTPWTFAGFAKNLQFVDRLLHMMQAGWTEFTPKETRGYGSLLKWIKPQNQSRWTERNTSQELYQYLLTKGAYS